MDDPVLESRPQQEIKLLCKAPRPILGPTLPSIQWVPVSFPGIIAAGFWCWPLTAM